MRPFLLLGAMIFAATVAFAQSSAPAATAEGNRPVAPFPLTYPLQQIPDTFYQNGIQYITLRPGMPWKQPVNDGKTFYLMQAFPRPRRAPQLAEPAPEPPLTAPQETDQP